MSAPVISDEILKRIEQNRLAAIARRKASEAAKAKSDTTTNSPALPTQYKVQTTIKYRNPYHHHGVITQINFFLISRDRFALRFKFDQRVPPILSIVPQKSYDREKKYFHFPLTSYHQCVNALVATNFCEVNPLPTYIMKHFINERNLISDYSYVDISRLEPKLLSKLYPFQVDGVKFGIHKEGRCLIADDMGLGKTIQAIAIADYFFDDWPLLIACPSTMRYQWLEEIKNYITKIPSDRINVLTKSKDKFSDPPPFVVITSYDLMSRCVEKLSQIKFGTCILDESHAIKNTKAKRTKAALELISTVKRCILLSGTPVLSKPEELYPQLKAIEPEFQIYKDYTKRYCNRKHSTSGSSNENELRVLLQERFMIRRLKSEVLKQLPPKVRQITVLDKDAIKMDKEVRQYYVEKLNSGELKGRERHQCLIKYYSETANVKIKALKDYISELLDIDQNKKFLLYGHHAIVLDSIAELLEEKKIFYIRIDGNVNSEERKSVCDQFQNEERFKVALLSITAAATGITLTAAHLVIFAELYWNPGILIQAEDRVHRIGQDDNVHIQYLLAHDTCDDYMWDLIKSKLCVINKTGLNTDYMVCAGVSFFDDDSKPEMMPDFPNEIVLNSEEFSEVDKQLEKIE